MPPLIYFHLNITKIIQPLNLSDARIEDISSQVHLASSTDKFHADSSIKTAPRF
jgi:hypothetical protein